jgi:hypothetical protein
VGRGRVLLSHDGRTEVNDINQDAGPGNVLLNTQISAIRQFGGEERPLWMELIECMMPLSHSIRWEVPSSPRELE